MEKISQLIDATPNAFHKVIANTNATNRTYVIRCLVDPNFENEDEIEDMYQAFIDICMLEVAHDRVDNVKIGLELPNLASMDLKFDVTRKCEMFKKSGPKSMFITMKVTYFDANQHKYETYIREVLYNMPKHLECRPIN